MTALTTGASPARSRSEYRAHHSRDDPAKLSTTVAHALADVMEVDVTETEFMLFDSVDPDALDRIFAPRADGTSRPFGHVAFAVRGYRVTVYSDGRIVVTPPPPRDVPPARPPTR